MAPPNDPVGSRSDFVETVLRNRPDILFLDILFLGDLVTSPDHTDHTGRLNKRLGSDLHDEWFVTTNTSTMPGRPVGVGATVHLVCPTLLGMPHLPKEPSTMTLHVLSTRTTHQKYGNPTRAIQILCEHCQS